MKPQLILYIGSLSPNCNCYKRYKTLLDLGYNVVGIDIDKSIYVKNITASIHHRFSIGYGIYKLKQQVIKAVDELKPDLIWVDNKPYLMESTLKKIIKKLPKVKLINVVTDDANGRYRSYWWVTRKTAKYYHHHFVQRTENIEEYYNWGAKKVDYCLRSFDPNFHKIVTLTIDEKKQFSCNVGFIGSYEEERAEFIAYLIKNGVAVNVIGDGWINKKYWSTIAPHFISKGVYSDEYVKRLNAMQIAVHFIRVANRDQQDSRTFEIPACGAFMIAQRTPVHEKLFDENKEAVFFDTKEELLEKVKYYLENVSERKAIAEAGHAKCFTAGYTHSDRLIDVLNKGWYN